jgi:hypothetical protein
MMNFKPLLLIASVITAVIIFFSWDSIYGLHLSVQELADSYSETTKTVDKKYLNKTLFVEGKVKAYYKLMGTKSVIELELNNNSIPVFFFFLTQEAELHAAQLQRGQKVVMKGKCLGKDEYAFVNGIKLDIEKFEE